MVIGLFVGATATFALFLAWEYHQGDNAMVLSLCLGNELFGLREELCSY